MPSYGQILDVDGADEHPLLPPGGRFVEARRCRRLGWLGPGGCSFGLPVPPRYISLVRQGCYRALPMGWRAARTLPPFWALSWPYRAVVHCAPERGVLSLRLSRRVRVLPPLQAGGRELELTVGQQLCSRPSSTPAHQRNALSRAKPVRTLSRTAAPYPAPVWRLETYCVRCSISGVQAQTFGCGSPEA